MVPDEGALLPPAGVPEPTLPTAGAGNVTGELHALRSLSSAHSPDPLLSGGGDLATRFVPREVVLFDVLFAVGPGFD